MIGAKVLSFGEKTKKMHKNMKTKMQIGHNLNKIRGKIAEIFTKIWRFLFESLSLRVL